MDRLKNKKVFLGKHSVQVQEKLFELGFKYASGSKELDFKVPFLYLYDNGMITIGNDLTRFNNRCFTEVTPEYILSLEAKKRPQWEDFGEISGYFVRTDTIVDFYENSKSSEETRNLFPSKEEAEACLALSQLCQWRDKYNGDWKPDWSDDFGRKYYINYRNNEISTDYTYRSQKPLVFKSAEIRDKFLEDFRDLIEQAKPLL